MFKAALGILIIFTALVSTPKLARVKLSKTVSAMVPETFTLMTDDELADKYPSSRKPVAMYVSSDKQVDFGMNVASQKFPGTDLKVMKDFYKANLYTLFNNVQIINESIENIKGRDYIIFEFISEVKPDEKAITPQNAIKKYSCIRYTLHNDYLLIFNFSCPERIKGEWESTAKKMMNSIQIAKSKK